MKYCSGRAFEHTALRVDANVVRAFPTSTNANEHVLFALGSDRMGRDDVEISRGRVSRRVSAGLFV